MILDPSLGDVVQKQRDAEHRAMLRLDGLDQLVGQREFRPVAALDLVEHADTAQQMLVDRVVMIHVELHHRHDAAECLHESAEDAGLVHPAQHGFCILLRGQDFQKQPIGFLVLADVFFQQLQRSRCEPHGVGMERQIALLREVEKPDQVDRIALEYVGARDVDAVIVDDENPRCRQVSCGSMSSATAPSRGSIPAPAWPAVPQVWRRGSR